MFEFLASQPPTIQALLGTLFTWFLTALGAAIVFFFKKMNKKLLDAMLGFAAGVMIAASFFSLILPAVELTESMGQPSWLIAAIGFAAGCVFLFIADKLIPHMHAFNKVEHREGVKTNWKKSVLLVTAITLHNIPEGLAVGVAFGAVAVGIPGATVASAVALAIGIGIQNFPEGAAVSIPLRREGFSRRKSFFFGQLSGMVEPIAGVLGAVAVIAFRPILPYALCFAAGAMIYVVVEELVPEGHTDSKSHIATIGIIIGFIVMMMLDLGLG
ncbi:MAG: ZIP family metal transporter [Clostridia bacterium]|jgi:zinc transporter, ZIP family|nr:ZIP family metal transporter [Clostridia bacterium]